MEEKTECERWRPLSVILLRISYWKRTYSKRWLSGRLLLYMTSLHELFCHSSSIRPLFRGHGELVDNNDGGCDERESPFPLP
jgi:hypothetical protein